MSAEPLGIWRRVAMCNFIQRARTSAWWVSGSNRLFGASPGGLHGDENLPTYRLLARVLLSWDVLDDDGSPLMPPAERTDDERVATWEAILYALPLWFLYELENQVFAAIRSGSPQQPSTQPTVALAA